MNYRKKILIILSLLGLLQPIQAQVSQDQSIEKQILFHINEYRQQHGLSKLIMNEQMNHEAKQHSQDMALHKTPFGHQYFSQRIARLHKQIKYSSAGAENVAYNYKTASIVVHEWLKSRGHKRNIDGNYNLTGIGIARDKQNKMYFTQIFLKLDSQKKQIRTKPSWKPWSIG